MFPKKKPAFAVIGVGVKKPGNGQDKPEAPDPLEKPKASPFTKRPPATDTADEGNDEAAEYEKAAPEYDPGKKLLSDIDAAGQENGMDVGRTRKFAADVFDAMAACLRRGASEESGEREEFGSDEEEGMGGFGAAG